MALLGLVNLTAVFAADQGTAQPYPWPWWPGMPWPTFGWIFPLVCFAMMVVMLLFMMRKGGMGCPWHGRSTDKTGSHDAMKRSWSGPGGSAMAILNERYARGEIDKKEYEEKKAAIAASG
jgi:uncharacterized membrane protein